MKQSFKQVWNRIQIAAVQRTATVPVGIEQHCALLPVSLQTDLNFSGVGISFPKFGYMQSRPLR